MATWLDLFALLATVAAFGGTIYGVLYVWKQISQGMENTKAKLKEQGLTISEKGVHVKTSKRFDREDYVDATQRGLVKAMNASSFRKAGADDSPGSSPSAPHLTPPDMKRSISSSSTGSTGSTKRSIFSRKKGKDKD